MNTLQQAEVDCFLSSGGHDNLFEVWPDGTFVDRARNGSAALKGALISAIQKRAEHAVAPSYKEDADADIFARKKFTPMVRGLFPQGEQSVVLDMLERSVVILTPAAINTALEKARWLSTAWKLANIHLASLDVKPLTDSATDIVGLSEETICYVSMKYFSNNNPLEDYVVHEAAHIFHNCKRETIGLPATRRREWLLEIDYAKRDIRLCLRSL